MIKIKILLASSDQKGSLGDKFRNNRFKFFEELVSPKITTRIKAST